MNKVNLFVGIFITVALALLAAGLFLIGNQHKAFRSHLELYTEFANVNGIGTGAKVQVDGMEAGQVESIAIPSKPSSKFRLKLQVDDRLHGLIRQDSVTTIETQGVVGDKFLLIHEGSDGSPAAEARTTLRSKEPFDMAKVLEQASDLVQQANGTMAVANSTIVDVRTKLDGTLGAMTRAVNNTNGIVTGIRRGHGTAGMLLEDKDTEANVREAILNTQQATANLNTASVQVHDLLTDFQSRHLFEQAQETLKSANGAVQQIDQATTQVNQTLTQALAQDQYGETAGANFQQSLGNINQATGNLADDTAALKQEFFFRGFFKKRGYEDLDHLPVTSYRDGQLFKKLTPHREWLAASALFSTTASGQEILSPGGRELIDHAVGQLSDVYARPIVVEGYAQAGSSADQLTRSRARAVLLRAYLQIHFHLQSKNIGVIALKDTPPVNAGNSTWDGVCLVQFSPAK